MSHSSRERSARRSNPYIYNRYIKHVVNNLLPAAPLKTEEEGLKLQDRGGRSEDPGLESKPGAPPRLRKKNSDY
jgi:hypothetical protein